MEISVTFSDVGKPKPLDDLFIHPAYLSVLYHKLKKAGRIELTADYDPLSFTTYKLRIKEVNETPPL